MRSLSILRYLVLFVIPNICRVNAKTVIDVFGDSGCEDSLGQVTTELIAINGDCAAVPKSTHSVKPSHIDSTCSGV